MSTYLSRKYLTQTKHKRRQTEDRLCTLCPEKVHHRQYLIEISNLNAF